MPPALKQTEFNKSSSVCECKTGVKVSQYFKPGCICIYFYPNTDKKRGERPVRKFLIHEKKKKTAILPFASSTDLGPDLAFKLQSSSAAVSSCATCRHWALCSPSGTAAEKLASKCFPCVYTHSSCVCTKVTGQQPHRAASFSSPEVFSLQGKTAFRADGEGAAGRRGRHSQPGCVEFFLKHAL